MELRVRRYFLSHLCVCVSKVSSGWWLLLRPLCITRQDLYRLSLCVDDIHKNFIEPLTPIMLNQPMGILSLTLAFHYVTPIFGYSCILCGAMRRDGTFIYDSISLVIPLLVRCGFVCMAEKRIRVLAAAVQGHISLPTVF
jgi:hypothetical protein